MALEGDVTNKRGDTIKLDQFLKLMGAVQTGGQAKLLIQSGEVEVNGQVETRRGRKLTIGDRVLVMGEVYDVASDGQ
jgi:ribosome-associated protein